MSNSVAYPILRTRDVQRALHAVDGLLALADLREIVLELWAITSQHSGLPRYVDAYGHWLHARGRDRMFADRASEKETGPQDPADPLFQVTVEVHGLGLVEERVVEAVGPDRARLEWWHNGWPEVPDLELGRQAKHAYVQLVFNASDIWATEPADGYTVFVHVGPEEPERAEWLARQVGLTVLGPGELGF